MSNKMLNATKRNMKKAQTNSYTNNMFVENTNSLESLKKSVSQFTATIAQDSNSNFEYTIPSHDEITSSNFYPKSREQINIENNSLGVHTPNQAGHGMTVADILNMNFEKQQKMQQQLLKKQQQIQNHSPRKSPQKQESSTLVRQDSDYPFYSIETETMKF